MEYDPAEVPELIEPIVRGVADVVYGSRLRGGRPQRAYLFWHLVGNRFLSLLTGLLFNTTLSDMETGYKAFRAEVLRSLDLREDGFGDRAGDHRAGLQARAAHLRAADLVLRPHLRRGQEDHLARRLQGDLGAARGAPARMSDAASPPRPSSRRGRVGLQHLRPELATADGMQASGVGRDAVELEHTPGESIPPPMDRLDHYRNWLAPTTASGSTSTRRTLVPLDLPTRRSPRSRASTCCPRCR